MINKKQENKKTYLILAIIFFIILQILDFKWSFMPTYLFYLYFVVIGVMIYVGNDERNKKIFVLFLSFFSIFALLIFGIEIYKYNQNIDRNKETKKEIFNQSIRDMREGKFDYSNLDKEKKNKVSHQIIGEDFSKKALNTYLGRGNIFFTILTIVTLFDDKSNDKTVRDKINEN